MLVELQIRNVALIEAQSLALGPGLSVFTGETGAGKSLLIDAVQAVLGGRVSADLIRTGCDQALVEAVFDLGSAPRAQTLLHEWGLGEPGEPTVVLTRELTRQGRHVARINRRPVSAGALRELAGHLVELCGQHEHQTLLQAGAPRELLDEAGGAQVLGPRGAYTAVWRELQETRAALARLGDSAAQRRELDLLQFQLQEIDQARPRPGEDAELAEERTRLQTSERRRQLATAAHRALYDGADAQSAAADLAGVALAALTELAALDPAAAESAAAVRLAAEELQAAGRGLRAYAEAVESDPERLEAVMARLDLLASLRRKYGETLEAVLAFREQVASELETLSRAGEREAALATAERRLLAELDPAARALSAARAQVAARLSSAATAAARRLGMPSATLSFDIRPGPPGPDGADDVRLLFSANPGEPPRPVARVASGGELSRITLALRTVTAAATSVPTLIFDEVDGGISGQAAQAVAEEMAVLGGSRQVLAVSHLAQLAAIADRHFHIAKQVVGQRTETTVRPLDSSAERTEELARIAGGSQVTEVTRRHALELLTTSGRRRSELRQSGKVS